MRAYVYPADVHGCGHYRLIYPAQALAAQGHDVTIIWPGQRDGFTAVTARGDDGRDHPVRVIGVPDDADVIVLQRVTHRMLAEAIPLIRARGVAVVVDQDDDLSSIHPANAAFANLHPRSGTGHSWEAARLASRSATIATVSTDALAYRYGRPGATRVLHNHIPEMWMDVPRQDTDLIGYAGSLHSHPDDVPQVGDAIARLVGDGERFRIIGPVDGFRAALGLDQVPDATGVVPFALWPTAVAQLGVGIAPLADSRFNQAKSWLKPLEYAAAGVPCVMSPTPEYARLHDDHGIGLLARREREWFRLVRRLARDQAMRQDMSAHGREVAASLTYERHAWRWAEVWAEAVQIERGKAAA